MKFILLAVLLTVVQTPPPVPGRAPDSTASTTKKVQKQPNSDQPNPGDPLTPDVSQAAPNENPHRADEATKNKLDAVRIGDLPAVTVNGKRDFFDWGSWLFNFFLVVVGGLQALLLCLTLRLIRHQATEMTRQRVLMGGQLKEMQSQLRQMKIASDQTDRLINQGRETNRPWLLIPMGTEFSEIGDPLLPDVGDKRPCHVSVPIKNFGQIPARIVSLKVQLYLGDSKYFSPKWKPYDDEGSVREDYTVAQTSVQPIQSFLEPNGLISINDRRAVLEAKLSLWLCGFIRYRDASDLKETGPLYETRICYVWINNTNRPQPLWIVRGPSEYNRST
jgi:hypothetical protein